jgi:lipid-A-disaccharide synthase
MASHDGPERGVRVVMLSAGETSGDLHGEGLCRAIRRLDPHVRLTGMGGPRMAGAGMEVLADLTAHAVVGGSEVFARLPRLFRAFRVLRARLGEERPRALVLIDFPEFNLVLARRARRAGVPVVYFIPPQVWAWRRGRVRTLRRLVSRVLAVLPFERALYDAARVPVSFVGHPLLDVVPLGLTREVARGRLGIGLGEPVLALLPGSRREEVARLLPLMAQAAAGLERAGAAKRTLLALAPSIARGAAESLLRAAGSGAERVEIVENATYDVLAAADAALVCSGTATLEAALLGTPMVVCYRISFPTAAIASLLVRARWVSLPNNILGRAVVPELVQYRLTLTRLEAAALTLLRDAEAREAQRAAFAELRQVLGEPGVAERAARAVLDVAGAPA